MIGVIWQFIIYSDGVDEIIGVPLGISLALVGLTTVGSVGYWAFSFIDSRVSQADAWQLATIPGTVFVLCFMFVLKSLVGAVLVCATAAWAVWNIIMHGEWSLFPIFNMVFKLVAEFLPAWTKYIYISLTLGYNIIPMLRVFSR